MFDLITEFLDLTGLWGVALLMFLENIFPPIPSELIMPLAGFKAAGSAWGLVMTIIAGTAGSLAGLTIWYWLGRKLGKERLMRFAEKIGRFATIDTSDIETASRWFDRHGGVAVLFGRLVPTVRTIISVPAGLARMPFWKFIAFSAVGTCLWTAALTFAGYVLESNYGRMRAWLNPLSTAIVMAVIALYVWGVIRYPARRRRRN